MNLPAAVSWPDCVGQTMFRPPFLGPSLYRVSSAILKRAAQSPWMLPGLSAAPGTERGRLSSMTACVQDRDYNCQWSPPPVVFATPPSPLEVRTFTDTEDDRTKFRNEDRDESTNNQCVKDIKVEKSSHPAVPLSLAAEAGIQWHGEPLHLATS